MHALHFAILELPLLIFCVALAFLTANSLRGDVFGWGQSLIAA